MQNIKVEKIEDLGNIKNNDLGIIDIVCYYGSYGEHNTYFFSYINEEGKQYIFFREQSDSFSLMPSQNEDETVEEYKTKKLKAEEHFLITLIDMLNQNNLRNYLMENNTDKIEFAKAVVEYKRNKFKEEGLHGPIMTIYTAGLVEEKKALYDFRESVDKTLSIVPLNELAKQPKEEEDVFKIGIGSTAEHVSSIIIEKRGQEIIRYLFDTTHETHYNSFQGEKLKQELLKVVFPSKPDTQKTESEISIRLVHLNRLMLPIQNGTNACTMYTSTFLSEIAEQKKVEDFIIEGQIIYDKTKDKKDVAFFKTGFFLECICKTLNNIYGEGNNSRQIKETTKDAEVKEGHFKYIIGEKCFDMELKYNKDLYLDIASLLLYLQASLLTQRLLEPNKNIKIQIEEELKNFNEFYKKFIKSQIKLTTTRLEIERLKSSKNLSEQKGTGPNEEQSRSEILTNAFQYIEFIEDMIEQQKASRSNTEQIQIIDRNSDHSKIAEQFKCFNTGYTNKVSQEETTKQQQLSTTAKKIEKTRFL